MTPQELKNSILQLAIQGKLVEQRPEEGTGEELYRQIQAEKQKLIREGKIKKEKPLPEIAENEVPFDIPESWKWGRFGELVFFNIGKTPPRAEAQWWGTDVPWVSIADMPESGHILSTKERVTSAAISEKFAGRTAKAGTLLMSFKLTVGRVSILDVDAVHNEAIISIYPYADKETIIRDYLFEILPLTSQSGESKNAIKGKTLNNTSISNLLIPLPPLAEQKRIVAKIEELLPLIDRYEKAWGRLEEFNRRFPADMQKSLLQMAIQGKLVEQRPEEGTGEELYRQIQPEKQRLIKEGKIKKEKPLPEIAEGEIPFDIPESWKWVLLEDLVCKSVKRGKAPSYAEQGRVLVFAQKCNTKKGIIDLSLSLHLDETRLNRYPQEEFLQDKDIVINSTGGGTMGRVGFYQNMDNPSCVPVVPDSHVTIVRVFNEVYANYIFYSLKYYQPYMEKQGTGSTNQTELSATTIRALQIPLPPLAEQKRIVAKLEKLLPLCERLK